MSMLPLIHTPSAVDQLINACVDGFRRNLEREILERMLAEQRPIIEAAAKEAAAQVCEATVYLYQNQREMLTMFEMRYTINGQEYQPRDPS